MLYIDYKMSRDLAWRILINEGIRELPVRTGVICRRMGIKIKLYVPEDGNSGYSMIVDGTPTIFVNQNDIPARQRFTVAHELGHILAGDVGKHKLVNREPSPDDSPIEQRANVFAVRFLAPACVLWGCNIKTAQDVVRLSDISLKAAQFRMERMKILYQRGMFLSHPLERQVFEQFRDYIIANKL